MFVWLLVVVGVTGLARSEILFLMLQKFITMVFMDCLLVLVGAPWCVRACVRACVCVCARGWLDARVCVRVWSTYCSFCVVGKDRVA